MRFAVNLIRKCAIAKAQINVRLWLLVPSADGNAQLKENKINCTNFSFSDFEAGRCLSAHE